MAKSNLKIPLVVFGEFIQIFRKVFTKDQDIMYVLKYDDKGSLSSKMDACLFVNKCIKAEAIVYPHQKNYRNVSNFISPNPKNLGHWTVYDYSKSPPYVLLERIVGNTIHPTWPELLTFCLRFIDELKNTNDKVFMEFASFIEQEYTEMKHLGLV